jgi:hypothetical protein
LFARMNVGRERRKLVQWATAFLEPAEQIQAVFKVGVLRVFGSRADLDAHMIAATDRAILVLHVDSGHPTPPERMPMRQPRNARFGQPHRRGRIHSSALGSPLHPSVVLGTETLVVPKRFFKDVAAADAALDGAGPRRLAAG